MNEKLLYNRVAFEDLEKKQKEQIESAQEEANKMDEEYDKLKGVMDYFSSSDLDKLRFVLERTLGDQEFNKDYDKKTKEGVEAVCDKVKKVYEFLGKLNRENK